jgi:hypothetical protein
MTEIKKQTVKSFRDRDSGATVQGFSVVDCELRDCVAVYKTPERRGTFKDISITNCKVSGCGVYGAVFHAVTLDTLEACDPPLQIFGSAFNRVVFRGKIGRVMLSPFMFPARFTTEQQSAFDEANSRFYKKVKWAIDIREAEFIEFELSGVPAKLVRRDPESQVVVHAAKFVKCNLTRLPLNSLIWQVIQQRMLQLNEPDKVLVAPKRAKDYERLVADLRLLQKKRIAEPD